MKPLDLDQLREYVNTEIVGFHRHKIQALERLTLKRLISKNPYLFRAKNIRIAEELISGLLGAFLSSSEEKLFGDFLEDLAVFVAGKTCGGQSPRPQALIWSSSTGAVTMSFRSSQAPVGAIAHSSGSYRRTYRRLSQESSSQSTAQTSRLSWASATERQGHRMSEGISRSLVRTSGT